MLIWFWREIDCLRWLPCSSRRWVANWQFTHEITVICCWYLMLLRTLLQIQIRTTFLAPPLGFPVTYRLSLAFTWQLPVKILVTEEDMVWFADSGSQEAYPSTGEPASRGPGTEWEHGVQAAWDGRAEREGESLWKFVRLFRSELIHEFPSFVSAERRDQECTHIQSGSGPDSRQGPPALLRREGSHCECHGGFSIVIHS